MKKVVLLILAVLSVGLVAAQTLNDKGIYVDDDDRAYNGTIDKTQNGIKTHFTVKEGIIDGEVVYYYASGKTMEKGMFSKGLKDQQWTRYNENGSISAIAFYSLGKKSGTWLVYDENGKKRFEMSYQDGEKTGIWTNWDENGQVASTKDYSKAN